MKGVGQQQIKRATGVGEREMMVVSFLSDGQRGSLSKQQISVLTCSAPPPPSTPIHQFKQRGTQDVQ